MQRIKNKLWKRGSTQEHQQQMETDENSTQDNQPPYYLSLAMQSPPLSPTTPIFHAITSTSTSPENTPEGSGQVVQSIEEALSSQVNSLTSENLRLQNDILKLNQELVQLQESQSSILSRNEDLGLSLELERKRFEWQKTFYEKKILDLTIKAYVRPTTNDQGATATVTATATATMSPTADTLDIGQVVLSPLQDELFYHETIMQLVAEQESKDGQIAEVKAAFEEKIKQLVSQHEADIAELVEANYNQALQMVNGHEELIKDLLTGCDGLLDEMKEEFLVEMNKGQNKELSTRSGRGLWAQFEGLSSEKKAVMVVGVTILTVGTAGWAGWGFIVWVWPRLLIFAESIAANPEVLTSWLPFLLAFLNSVQFQSFINAWEEGQPLGTCLKSFVNTDFLSSALQMAPNLFLQLKNKSTSMSVVKT